MTMMTYVHVVGRNLQANEHTSSRVEWCSDSRGVDIVDSDKKRKERLMSQDKEVELTEGHGKQMLM